MARFNKKKERRGSIRNVLGNPRGYNLLHPIVRLRRPFLHGKEERRSGDRTQEEIILKQQHPVQGKQGKQKKPLHSPAQIQIDRKENNEYIMVLGWAALTIFIYICLYGPIIGGLIECLKSGNKIAMIGGIVTAVWTIIITIIIFCQ